jgi:hypothetical protein
MHQAAVAQTTQARGGVNARNPQAAEIALAVAAVAKCVEQGLEHCFIGAAIEQMLGAILALSKL